MAIFPSTWLDIYRIQPGTPWREEIENALKTCSSCAIVLGPSGWGENHLAEARLALEQRRSGSHITVIAVLLPGASLSELERLGDLSADFSSLHYADFRSGNGNPAALGALVAAIRGMPVEPPVGLSVFRIRRDARRWDASQRKDSSKLYRGADLLEAQRVAQQTGYRPPAWNANF